jgi:spermidine/putrescine transport system ATP-binding protein
VETPVGALSGVNARSLRAGSPAILFIRPELLSPGAGGGETIEATLDEVAFEGTATHLFVSAGPGGQRLQVLLSGAAARDIPAIGARIRLSYRAEDALVLPPDQAAHA